MSDIKRVTVEEMNTKEWQEKFHIRIKALLHKPLKEIFERRLSDLNQTNMIILD